MRLVAAVRHYVDGRHWRRSDVSYSGLRLAQGWSHRGVVIWFYLLSAVFLFSPSDWFGPTWSHFDFLPHGGTGIGVTCLALGTLLMAAIWLRSRWLISVVLLLGAAAFWLGAFLIGAQALAGRTGLMEVPMMMYISVDLLIRAAIVKP